MSNAIATENIAYERSLENGPVLNRAVFLDRDGVLIENREDYVKSWDDVEFIDVAFDAVRRLTDAGLSVVMTTNQSAVGRGIITVDFLEELHKRMLHEFSIRGGKFAGVYYCPHHPNAGCSCRKPGSGMLLSASRDLGLDLSSSVMVGDTLTDIQAAHHAGARGILVLTGKGRESSEKRFLPEYESCRHIDVVSNIGEAVDVILLGDRKGDGVERAG